ncbi:MAG: bifunctional methylenetetrahydrofolate dehydrogenase/methenyltetrahydrofolate cyclohydrolase FolD [Candidatus Altiarchaeales archaeon]|nr:MAG: bifunctional methylenetetrahydrofolate dehydrogenase/methenyltetrahydrofolate cyclohydrolase FolD [Candidatus Altiarchaeales archaeon]
MGRIIDGKKISLEIRKNLAFEVRELMSKGIHPSLSTILVGDDPASELYIKMKTRACEDMGIKSKNFHLPADTKESELLQLIDEQNRDPAVHGILVQLPLPEHIDRNNIFNRISPIKDVDGINPVNIGNLLMGNEVLVSCTPKGIIRIFEYEGIDLKGREIVIISHSVLIGKPLAMLLLNRNATVTICHVHTKNLKKHTKNAEILIVAAGVPNLISGDMLGDNAIVIDVGINRVNGKIVGDVDFEDVRDKVSLITPVPGGVGPMTITMLLENTIIAAKMSFFG